MLPSGREVEILSQAPCGQVVLLGKGVLVLWDYLQVHGSVNAGVFPCASFPSIARKEASWSALLLTWVDIGFLDRNADPEWSNPEILKVAAAAGRTRGLGSRALYVGISPKIEMMSISESGHSHTVC